MTIGTFLSVLLLLASLPIAAAAQPAIFPGQPLDNVAIALENVESGKVVSRGVTGNDGFVRFYDVPGGSYRIVAKGIAKAIEKQAAAAARLVAPPPAAPPSVLPSPVAGDATRLSLDRLAPPPPEPEPGPGPAATFAARRSLAMPVRPAAVIVRMVAPGTTREARKVDTLLIDGVEMLAFTVAVSGPISVSLRHEDQ